jgi:hypothetical protein
MGMAMFVKEIFARWYSKYILLSPFQAKVTAGAIRLRAPGCRLLVFGLGNDTGLWLNLNADGTTLFLETEAEWAAAARAKYPAVDVCIMPAFGTTVATSFALTGAQLAAFEMPAALRGTRWDVILVDAPKGHQPQDPGRAVAIFWAAALAAPAADIFVDDYDRPLERAFADVLIRRARPGLNTVVPASDAVPERQLFWSMGRPESSPAG